MPKPPFAIRKIGHVVLRVLDLAHTLEEAIDPPVPGRQAALRDPSLRESKP